jgi:antitoxin MazE
LRTKLIRIGNSQGVRIPRPVIEQAGLNGEIELTVESGALVLRGVRSVREGWAAAYASMAEQGDDILLDADELGNTSWDDEDWEWA